MTSVEHHRRYFEECFSCFYSYNESQWGPKTMLNAIGSHSVDKKN